MKKYYNAQVGEKYNHLLILSREGNYIGKSGKESSSKFLCKCDCGDINYYRGSSLIKNLSIHCRHCAAKNRQKTFFKKGDIINNLTVLSDEYIIRQWSDSNRRFYLCKCACGNESYYPSSRLNTKKAIECKSCAYKKRPQSIEKLTPLERLFSLSIYQRSKKKNLKVSITLIDFEKLIKQCCFYCGKEPQDKKYLNGIKNIKANGIDRIDSSKGYEIGNVVACCTKCNMAKNDMSKEDFLNHITKIYNYICPKQEDIQQVN